MEGGGICDPGTQGFVVANCGNSVLHGHIYPGIIIHVSCCCYLLSLLLRWLGMHRQSETRAGNHRRHTRTRNASLPTQANNAERAANSKPPTRVLYIHLTRTPHTHHTHPVPPRQRAQIRQHSTQRAATGTRPAHTQLKSRRQGSPPAPKITLRHRSACSVD